MERLKKKKKIGEGLLLLFIGAMPSNKQNWSPPLMDIMDKGTYEETVTATDGRAVLINDFKSRVYSMSSHWVPGFVTVNQ